MTERIQEFLRNRRKDGLDTEPCLVVDLDASPRGDLWAAVGPGDAHTRGGTGFYTGIALRGYREPGYPQGRPRHYRPR